VYFFDVSASIPELESASARRVGFVMISWQGAPTNFTDHASVTWDGVTMTAKTPVEQGSGYSQAFYLIGAAHNGTYDITVSGNMSNTPTGGIALITVGWSDHDSGDIAYDNEATNSAESGDTASVDVPISAAGLVVSASGHAANGLDSVSGCTVLQEWDSGGNCFFSAYSEPTGAGTPTHTHIYSQSESWTAVGMSFVVAESGGLTAADNAKLAFLEWGIPWESGLPRESA
jgi:hypothetical protein